MRTLFALLCSIGLVSCGTKPTDKATFTYFEYKGLDDRFNQEFDPQTQYQNPIFAGFYPDPSFCRKGNDYYMVHSSFSYYPGVPIHHSTDLVNWTQIGHVLNRPSQLKLDSLRLSAGIYAPAIEYNKHNDTFYMITTCVEGIGNFVVKTKDPKEGNWSEPIHLPEVGGIDPSLFFDDDGKAYIVHNDDPDGPSEWEGHKAIWIHNYDVETDKTFGEKKVIIEAGVDRTTKPIWIEGPHLYKVKGKYYLMAAEGGTSVDHREVVFSADDIKGPYKPAPINPILTQRGMPEPRPDIVTSTGHADMIETADGEWFAAFLACRPYEGNHYNTGRETFLLPVKWENGQPIILDKGLPVPTIVDKKGLKPEPNFFTGNFTWKDEFDTDKLDHKWVFIRTPRGDWWKLGNEGLTLSLWDKNIYEVDNPAFIGRRQQHLAFEAETELNFVAKNDAELAGLVCYQKETHNIVFAKTIENDKHVLKVVSTGNDQKSSVVYTIPKEYVSSSVILKVTGKNASYNFLASFDKGKTWQAIAENVDAKILSTESAGGFSGAMIGMYATSKK